MLPRLHVVTDDAVLCGPEFGRRAEDVLEAHGAALALHLRGHGLGGGELFRLVAALAPVAEAAGALLFVNDRVDIARAMRLPGVVLGRRSLPIGEARRLLGAGVRIGFSAHAAGEVAAVGARSGAERTGADFVLFGHVYATASHPAQRPAGVARLGAAATAAGVPVVAIGGIVPGRVADVLAAGAHGVAALGGIWHDEDPVAAASRYLEALEQGGRASGDDRDHVER